MCSNIEKLIVIFEKEALDENFIMKVFCLKYLGWLLLFKESILEETRNLSVKMIFYHGEVLFLITSGWLTMYRQGSYLTKY